jgi:hypothetical protein
MWRKISVRNPNPDPHVWASFNKTCFLFASWRSMMKTAGSGSISQRHVSADPDPHKNVMDPQHCGKFWQGSGSTLVWLTGPGSGPHWVKKRDLDPTETNPDPQHWLTCYICTWVTHYELLMRQSTMKMHPKLNVCGWLAVGACSKLLLFTASVKTIYFQLQNCLSFQK